MARLGELLVEAKLLIPEQVDQALRAQVMWGGRLGTNLIELGLIDLDTLSQMLARQHKLPAALARHFERADPDLQRKLSPDFAERFTTVPLMRVKVGKVVIASIGPLEPKALAIVGDELEIDPEMLVPSVAAELRIRYQLERAYNIPRGARFLRARGKTLPPLPQFVVADLDFEDSQVQKPIKRRVQPAIVEPVVAPVIEAAPEPIELADLTTPTEQPEDIALSRTDTAETPFEQPVEEPLLHSVPLEPAPVEAPPISEPVGTLDTIANDDDLSVPTDPATEASLRERRKYVRMITDEPAAAALGRIAIRRVAVTTPPQNQTLGEATRAIRRGTDRDKVAELVMSTLERFVQGCDAVVLLVLRGDSAVGWKGFCRGGTALPEVAIPLEQPGLVPNAVKRGCSMRAPTSDLGPIDQLLYEALGGTGERELIVVPVTIGGQVMLTISFIANAGCEISAAESIAAATGAAFARLMRDASR